ncbi:hypothetical protein EP837_01727 [Sphingobium sp. EP60837]|nr:hypothetical protein EP837_01727 [Sphingobium sp. EP60837]
MSQISCVDAIWDNLPSRRELHSRLDHLALPADAKVLMGRLLETTATVAGRIIEVGRRILSFVLEMVRSFPGTTLGALVGLTVTSLVGSIPLLGFVLGPIAGPLLAAFMITQGALADMRNSTVERQIALFGAKLDAVVANG